MYLLKYPCRTEILSVLRQTYRIVKHIKEVMAETKNTPNKVLGSQARETVFRVFDYFNSNKSEEQNLSAVKLKVSCATAVSVRTIERIVKEGKT